MAELHQTLIDPHRAGDRVEVVPPKSWQLAAPEPTQDSDAKPAAQRGYQTM